MRKKRLYQNVYIVDLQREKLYPPVLYKDQIKFEGNGVSY